MWASTLIRAEDAYGWSDEFRINSFVFGDA
jgi:hypothetical protein